MEKQIFFFAPRILSKKPFTGSELEDMARGFPVCLVGYSVSDLTFVVRFLTGYEGLAEGGGRPRPDSLGGGGGRFPQWKVEGEAGLGCLEAGSW